MKYFVYLDETTESIPRPFYVGKGNSARLKRRERNQYWKRIVTKYEWTRRVIAEFNNEAEAFELEIALIRLYGTFEGDPQHGVWGANLTEGGEGASGFKFSTESKQKLSEAHKGKPGTPHSEEWKAKISSALKGKPGRPQSENTRAKISASLKGISKSEEHCSKLSAATKGKPRRPMDLDHMAKLVAFHTGRKRSEETKQKIREGIARRNAEKASQSSESLSMSKAQSEMSSSPKSTD